MATVTPTQPISTLTPPSSSHGNRGLWDYAVPLDHDQNPITRDYKSFPNSDSISNPQTHSRQPLSQQTNGVSRQNDSNTDLSETQYAQFSENDYLALAPAKGNGNSLRNKHGAISKISEADSLIDLYKSQSAPSSRTTSRSAAQRNVRKASGSNGVTKRTPEEDESYWIHRDKLAQIESKELEEAGFRVGRRPSERQEPAAKREEKRQRLASPVRMEEEEAQEAEAEAEEYEDPAKYDYHTPDEMASSPPTSFLPKPAARTAGSRIPKPRGGGPSPPTQAGESPGRSRNNSSAWNSLGESPKSQPSTQASAGAAGDYEDNFAPPDTPPLRSSSGHVSDQQSSPQRAKLPSKSAPTARKTGTTVRNVTVTKSRTPSAQAKPAPELKRPGTSSGTPRPSTSHRPEGEAPWISSMYKPDPRLPPEQQLLPTHAKRLAQEQWEKEGKTGTVYDREFRLLNSDFPQPQPESSVGKRSLEPTSPIAPSFGSREKTTVLNTKWSMGGNSPLGSPRSQSSGRPGTSGTDREHGGYSTMPTIATPQSPPANQHQNRIQQMDSLRLMDAPEDEGDKKKGCAGCGCTVM